MRHLLLIALTCAVTLVSYGSDPVGLTVMTYNLHAGSDASIEEIASVINAESPDFVTLQEVDVFTHRANAPQHNGNNMISQLASATNMFPLYGRTLNFAGGYYGIGLLSKHPCVEYHVIDLPNPYDVEPRVLLEGVFLVDGVTPVTVASTHLSVESAPTRLLQAATIADRYLGASTPVIVGGDFNSTPDSDAVATLTTVLQNLSGISPTFPPTTPAKKLDYIFGTKDIIVNSAKVLIDENPKSDHCPVVTDITVKP